MAAANFIYPVFVHESDDAETPIPSLPGVSRLGVNRLAAHLAPAVADGLRCVLIFGVLEDEAKKDEQASYASDARSPVIRAVRLLRDKFPGLTIACDLCLCAYTSHGHCGMLEPADACINLEKSVDRLAQVGLAYAQAGAHVLAPSDMMDGRIEAIKVP